MDFDLIIIGAGLAGCCAGITAAQNNLRTAVISKVHPLRSHSVAAQGGINIPIDEQDIELHIRETLASGSGIADADAVSFIVKNAQQSVEFLQKCGSLLQIEQSGELARRNFGGQKVARTCYYKDRTGLSLLNTAYEQALRAGVQFFDECEVFDIQLKSAENNLHTIKTWKKDKGKILNFTSEFLLIANGGYAGIYPRNSNCLGNIGNIQSILFQKGIPLIDLEFVQFHPTGLTRSGILLSEAARGEGGYLLNSQGRRFMTDYDERAELAPRDIVARAIFTEIEQGRGVDSGDGRKTAVHLDLRHISRDKILEKLPEIYDLVLNFTGKDLSQELIEVAPTAHYSMGGLPVNANGQVLGPSLTPVDGLFAAGEAACMSLHGANRLGGNSLLETIVGGFLAGSSICLSKKKADLTTPLLPSLTLDRFLAEAEKTRPEGNGIFSQKENCNLTLPQLTTILTQFPAQEFAQIAPNFSFIIEEIKQSLANGAGIFRDQSRLADSASKLERINASINQIFSQLEERATAKASTDTTSRQSTDSLLAQPYLPAAQELLDLRCHLILSQLIIESADARKESRAAHQRSDFPTTDTNFQAHSLIYLEGSKLMIKYTGVNNGQE
ncbi:MAG: FAD-binding protein [Spirochaetales bacterium]|nr:FAD-binding protein [Spirochaetales bacterium]